MNTFTEILKSLPLTAFRSNSAGTAFTDITGRGVALSATPTLVTPINAGSTRSMLINAPGVNFASGVFIRGQEKREFSLELTFLPMDILFGSHALLSHVSAYDGLAVIDRELRFTVEFNTTGSVYVAYQIPENFKKMVVVATYSRGAIKMYVNGESVGSAEVSAAQIKDGFKTRANNNLYMGPSTGLQASMVDAVAIYSRALRDSEAYMHYLGANNVVDEDLATESLRPVTFDGTGHSIYSSREWSGRVFSDGVLTDSSVDDTGLFPQINYTTQLSQPGSWIGTLDLPTSAAIAKVYTVKLEYEGVGSFSFSASKDGGTTWFNPATYTELSGTFDWAPTGQPILVRIMFDGGIADDPSKVTRIKVTAYDSPNLLSTASGRTITLTAGNLTSDERLQPIEHQRFNGLYTNGSAFTMTADTDVDDPQPVFALETWITLETSLTNAYIFDNRPDGGTHYLWSSGGKFLFPAGGTLYVNGVAAASNTANSVLGVPYHIIYVFPASFNTPITFNLNYKIYDLIKVYASTLTASDAARIYSAYLGYPVSRLVTESNPVTETGTPYKTYAYDWSITQAG